MTVTDVRHLLTTTVLSLSYILSDINLHRNKRDSCLHTILYTSVRPLTKCDLSAK